MSLCQVMTSAGKTVFGIGGAACTNEPPQAVARVTTPAECSSPAGATVLLDGAASSDQDSITGSRDDIVGYTWFEDFGTAAELRLGEGETLEATLPLGPHAVVLQVEDLFGETSTASVAVEVVDTTAPELAISLLLSRRCG